MEKVTSEILNHHLAAFGGNDLVEIMKDYTEESELFTPAGPLKGLDSIKKFFADYFVTVPTGSFFEMKQLTVSGNAAYIVWESESEVAKILLGTDTFVFDGDKIRYHTVADYRVTK